MPSIKLFRSFRAATTAVVLGAGLLACSKADVRPGWPEVHVETRPWSRWWWHGSAVTEAGITAELEAYKRAGIGGLEITPIYGVYGYEDSFVEYLSLRWMQLFEHTLREADRLGLGIDMATGTGWPFGGPWIGEADACKDMHYAVYTVAGGKKLSTPVAYIQESYVRAVGNSLYTALQRQNSQDDFSRLKPGSDPKQLSPDSLRQPIATTAGLQALALDQVKFKKPLALKTLMAYNEQDSLGVLELTQHVDSTGVLQWTAPPGTWQLYAIFEGSHGKMVERAGPGGEGNVIDHFSTTALNHYLARFDSAFADRDISGLRAFFNDSYEVDDARGAADWTPALFAEFQKRRGYDLKQHLPALFGQDTPEKNARILCDYRETISDLVLANFTRPWRLWAYGKAAMVRNQAHGAPANILDLYGEVDIPEIEGEDALRIKMASAAGNVTGKRLISSESATWLDEHFQSSLGDIKGAVDRFLVNGVNHVFYHGTCYSPPNEPWPGWLFYAAVHMNPRNPEWQHAGALNEYITRTQSFLQQSMPDQDVLLYFPIYDRFSAPGNEMIEHFDGVDHRHQFDSTAFRDAAGMMVNNGYAFDYISDKQIARLTTSDHALHTAGNSVYRVLILPRARYMPIATLRKAVALAEQGATVIAYHGLPENIAGFANLKANQHSFDSLRAKLTGGVSKAAGTEIRIGRGRWLEGSNLGALLAEAGARRETAVDNGIEFLRKRRMGNRTVYFLVNKRDESFDGWIDLAVAAPNAVVYNTWTGVYGQTAVKHPAAGRSAIYLQLQPGESVIVELYQNDVEADWYPFYTSHGRAVRLQGKWHIAFNAGNPTRPKDLATDSLVSWTLFGQAYEDFSGTATYRLQFKQPAGNADAWLLDLGKVSASARVRINGKTIGTVVGPAYTIVLEKGMLEETNVIEIEVANLMANAIAALDRQSVFWKKFYNVNVAARKPENRKEGIFDAAGWKPHPSGVLGPITLQPLKRR